jgi:hypothetical protein
METKKKIIQFWQTSKYDPNILALVVVYSVTEVMN